MPSGNIQKSFQPPPTNGISVKVKEAGKFFYIAGDVGQEGEELETPGFEIQAWCMRIQIQD